MLNRLESYLVKYPLVLLLVKYTCLILFLFGLDVGLTVLLMIVLNN